MAHTVSITANGNPIDSDVNRILELDATVVLLATPTGGSGNFTYQWNRLDRPVKLDGTPSAADFVSPTLAQTDFTPLDVEGSYLGEVEVTDVDESPPLTVAATGVLAVRTLRTGARIPAAGEEGEAGARGWAEERNEDIRFANRLTLHRGFADVCQVDEVGGIAIADVVVSVTGVVSLDNNDSIPLVKKAQASDTTTGAIGVVTNLNRTSESAGPFSEQTPPFTHPLGSLVLVRFAGLVGPMDTDSPGFTSVGEPVYLASGGGITPTPPVPPDIVRQIGNIAVVHVSAGWIYLTPSQSESVGAQTSESVRVSRYFAGVPFDDALIIGDSAVGGEIVPKKSYSKIDISFRSPPTGSGNVPIEVIHIQQADTRTATLDVTTVTGQFIAISLDSSTPEFNGATDQLVIKFGTLTASDPGEGWTLALR